MRNPSPPPLTKEEKEVIEADYIGETLFSKRFVLSMLVKLYKLEADIYKVQKNDSEKDDSNDASCEVLSDPFEHDICELWDMTANADVAQFLYDNDGMDIIFRVLEKTSSPRLMEITFGILGNIVCIDKICVSFSSNEVLRKTFLNYFSIRDALSLVELTRCLITCLSNQDCTSLWLEDITEHFEALKYILRNSLEGVLVDHAVTIIDIVFDASEDIIEAYFDRDFLNALKESYGVLFSERKGDTISNLVHVFQLVSTSNKGVIELTEDISIAEFLCHGMYDHRKGWYVIDNQTRYYSSIYSELNSVLSVLPEKTLALIEDNTLVVEVLIQELSRKTTLDFSKEDVYIPVYLDFFKDLMYNFNSEKFKEILKQLVDSKKDISKICNNVRSSSDAPKEWTDIVDSIETILKTCDVIS